MSKDYTLSEAVAARLISNFGATGQLVKLGNSGGFDDFGEPLASQPDTIINGTVTPLLQYKSIEINGESIQSGDAYVYFDTTEDIEINMTITINSVLFRVIDVYQFNSVGGVRVFNRLQLRR